ncbi:lysoplasmalogenase family protein [Ottowia thiooxydans]|uniref:lysoplasmalogenase family protein n=1 Tax=Ottowia thiooxydans TaxID=219182 RepID=UPI00041C4858|nr:lysoplasmalogenase family protein [Ottowia thiooxydans]
MHRLQFVQAFMTQHPSQIIVFATPVFLLLILIEWAWGKRKQRDTYRMADAINSLGLGVLSQISAVFMSLLRIGLYTAVFEYVALFRADAFWTTWYGWVLALLFYDLCYYWLHRMGHESAVLWAAHVVHHQSQHYNLSTALRQTSSGALFGWIFYLPMALAGVPPVVFGVVALIDLLYQFWVHTEHVPKLGWFDRWFCSPSNHRVHHAVNDRYLDRNYGGILIVWDRIFGSFLEEDERDKPIYGTRSPLNSWDPLWANAEVYWALAQDSWRARRWSDKLRVWLKPPGWRPPDVAARWPKSPFDITAVRPFEPPTSRGVQWFAGAQFIALIAGAAMFLWQADSAPLIQSALWFGVLVIGLWAVGALLQGRIGIWQVLMIESAALATVTAALGMIEWHRIFKPLVMVCAIAFVTARVRAMPAPADKAFIRFELTLALALGLSMLGDVALMFEGYFIPGLVAFLLAHLAYIALFKRDVPWFPSRGALAATLSIGLAMYAFLWTGGLPPALRIPVAAYVTVIALMAAQAIGRFRISGDQPSMMVALGACFFMLSDALLATNRFVSPLPLAHLWVLSTYYAAQILITVYARPVLPSRRPRS